ncbi:MAG: hypothetical protein GY829_12060 [Gammaproteobacteria bacterium]|nr:hypothetical protein [Gammaproteobacteria bacterium]
MPSIAKLFENSKIDIFQLIKQVVYLLLLINFAIYVKNDIEIAAHTMSNGGSFLDWTAAFATTIDESAWIILLILFELETYVMSDEKLSRTKSFLMHSARIVCYFSLAHTCYAYSINVYDLSLVTPISAVSNLCQLVDRDLSFTTNLLYSELNSTNCGSLSTGSKFFFIDPPENLIVTDAVGLVIEKQLGWVDIIEAITWLLILVTIEMVVWLQDREITGGWMMKSVNMAKFFLYAVLWGAISYWIYRDHWMFAWDEFVWIAGFMAIEMNVSEWRDEIREKNEAL